MEPVAAYFVGSFFVRLRTGFALFILGHREGDSWCTRSTKLLDAQSCPVFLLC